MTIALTVLVPFCLLVSSLPDLPNHYRNPTRPIVYKGWSEEQPNDELPSAYGSDQEEATLLLVILPPHAHASRRCETQAAQSAKLRLAFRSVDPFRALWEPDRRRRGRRTAFPALNKGPATNQNNPMTGRAHTTSNGFSPLVSLETIGPCRSIRWSAGP